jgi:hypothetical protein
VYIILIPGFQDRKHGNRRALFPHAHLTPQIATDKKRICKFATCGKAFSTSSGSLS